MPQHTDVFDGWYIKISDKVDTCRFFSDEVGGGDV